MRPQIVHLLEVNTWVAAVLAIVAVVHAIVIWDWRRKKEKKLLQCFSRFFARENSESLQFYSCLHNEAIGTKGENEEKSLTWKVFRLYSEFFYQSSRPESWLWAYSMIPDSVISYPNPTVIGAFWAVTTSKFSLAQVLKALKRNNLKKVLAALTVGLSGSSSYLHSTKYEE